MSNKLIFKIEQFEGPLDLLLELFKKEKIEITEVNLNIILDQYVEFINELQQQKYNIAVEYLDLMAEIILYKSRKILSQEDEEEEIEEQLNKEELIQRLLEYKTYKEATIKIHKLESQRNQYLVKDIVDLSEFKEVKLKNIQYEQFYKIIEKTFAEIYLKEKKEKSKVVTKKDYNINEYIEELKTKEQINFKEEIKDKSKKEAIIIFLAILEILKIKEYTLLISQENIIVLKEKNE